MRRMRICFTDVFFFVFFRPSQKYQTAERIFMKLLPNDSGEKYFPTSYRNGARPPINFLGLKTTHCALGGDGDAWRVSQN